MKSSSDEVEKWMTTMKDSLDSDSYVSESPQESVYPEVFRPLIRKLSGVVRMDIMENKDRRILLIGDWHGTNYCREQGFAPLSQLIEPFLKKARYVDFFIELSMTEADSICKTDAERKAIRRGSRTEKKETKSEIIADVSDLVSVYVRNSKWQTKRCRKYKVLPFARVHAIDVRIEMGSRSTGSRLLNLLRDAITGMDRDNIDSVETTQVEAFLNEHGQTAVLDRLNERSAQLKLAKWMLHELSQASQLRKCFGRRNFSQLDYLDVFLRNTFKTKSRFFFWFYRFVMDINTCCRLMKTEAGWYKNIVVYAGASHTTNCVMLLSRNGFRHTPINKDFNPMCESEPHNSLLSALA